MPVIEFETPRLRLRRWRAPDRKAFADLNADPRVMEHFVAPLTRAQSDATVDFIESHFASHGWGCWATEVAATGEFIGFIGISIPKRTFSFSPCVEVGWRLAFEAWGHGYASEGARGALAVAFEHLALPEVVSFTALGNRRSRAVMERIGMRNANADFDHPGVPEGLAVRRHCLYCIRREEWKDSGGARGTGPAQ